MPRWLVVWALIAGCRGEPAAAPARAAPAPRPPRPAIVPALPPSPDGVREIRALDRRIALHAGEPARVVELLLERAWVHDRLDDYLEALQRSAAWVAREPDRPEAWRTRVRVLTRVHEVEDARAALDRLRPLVADPGELDGLAATIDEIAGGARGRAAAAYRARAAREVGDPAALTQWAASLAASGRLDEALAVMQRVPAQVHDNAPALLAWILFQWARIYERKGEPAAARALLTAARDRMPTLEITVHLAEAIAATGGDPRALVAAALADDRHPGLLALAGEIDAARRGWDRYAEALPRAFAGHAARFYLTSARDPVRALALAEIDHAGRDTRESRALVIEAALAARAPGRACALAAELADGAPGEQFLAWRAWSACGRADDATALAARLGIQ